MNEDDLKRIVQRIYPELTGGLHLPLLAKVEVVHPVTANHQSSNGAPGYCVDVQLLKRNGEIDTAVPVLEQVPLHCTGAGNSRGVFVYPTVGALVELGFFYGQANMPFVKTILTTGQTLPDLAAGDLALFADANNFYRINENGDIVEKCEGVAERLAQTAQRLKVADGGKVWLGSESENVLQILSDTIALLKEVATHSASHKHPSVNAPSDKQSALTTSATNADTIHGRLSPLI